MHKNEKLSSLMDTPEKTKRQSIHRTGEKLSNHVSDMDLAPKIYKEDILQTSYEQNNPTKTSSQGFE